MPTTPRKHILALVVLLILCFAVAGVGGLATAPSIPNWYAGLVKPSWTPPGWVFGPVWSVVGGGLGALLATAWTAWQWPQIRAIGALHEVKPAATAPSGKPA